jgi:uncharacterized membrane protein YccC
VKKLGAQQRNRAEALVALSTGVITFDDVLSLAATQSGRDLRILRLRDVLRDAKGVNAKAILEMLEEYGMRCPQEIKLRDVLTQRNMAMLVDAMNHNTRQAPNPDWPFVFVTRATYKERR